MKKNMFNTVKKGIIRSAALLLLAGFCGNISADYSDFEKAITKGDFKDASKTEETIKSFCEKIKSGDIAYNAIKPDEIDSKITENAELSGIFAGVLQKNYEISEILKHLADKEKDPSLKERYETAIKNFDYNLLEALLKGKLPNGKISNKDEADFIKVAYRSFYNNAGNLLVAYRTKSVTTFEINSLQDALKDLAEENQELKDQLDNVPPAIDLKTVSLDDLKDNVSVNQLSGELQKAQDNLVAAQKDLDAILGWSNASSVPGVSEKVDFENSELKKLIDGLNAAAIDVDALAEEGLQNNAYVKGLNDKITKLNNDISTLNTELNKVKTELALAKAKLTTGKAEDLAQDNTSVKALFVALEKVKNDLITKTNQINTLTIETNKLLPIIKPLKDNVAKLNSEKADLQIRLQSAQNEKEAIEKQIEAKYSKDLTEMKAELAKQIENFQNNIKVKDAEIARLRGKNEELVKKIEFLEQNAVEQINQMQDLTVLNQRLQDLLSARQVESTIHEEMYQNFARKEDVKVTEDSNIEQLLQNLKEESSKENLNKKESGDNTVKVDIPLIQKEENSFKSEKDTTIPMENSQNEDENAFNELLSSLRNATSEILPPPPAKTPVVNANTTSSFTGENIFANIPQAPAKTPGNPDKESINTTTSANNTFNQPLDSERTTSGDNPLASLLAQLNLNNGEETPGNPDKESINTTTSANNTFNQPLDSERTTSGDDSLTSLLAQLNLNGEETPGNPDADA